MIGFQSKRETEGNPETPPNADRPLLLPRSDKPLPIRRMLSTPTELMPTLLALLTTTDYQANLHTSPPLDSEPEQSKLNTIPFRSIFSTLSSAHPITSHRNPRHPVNTPRNKTKTRQRKPRKPNQTGQSKAAKKAPHRSFPRAVPGDFTLFFFSFCVFVPVCVLLGRAPRHARGRRVHMYWS